MVAAGSGYAGNPAGTTAPGRWIRSIDRGAGSYDSRRSGDGAFARCIRGVRKEKQSFQGPAGSRAHTHAAPIARQRRARQPTPVSLSVGDGHLFARVSRRLNTLELILRSSRTRRMSGLRKPIKKTLPCEAMEQLLEGPPLCPRLIEQPLTN
jgi:hypothetical protein